jgi:hypothetical protein
MAVAVKAQPRNHCWGLFRRWLANGWRSTRWFFGLAELLADPLDSTHLSAMMVGARGRAVAPDAPPDAAVG